MTFVEHRILVGKHPLGFRRRRWEHSTEIDLQGRWKDIFPFSIASTILFKNWARNKV
jgi:hypothetical protein